MAKKQPPTDSAETAVSSVFQHTKHAEHGLELAKEYAAGRPALTKMLEEALAVTAKIKAQAQKEITAIDPRRKLE
jgi:hypothetical protein